MKVKEITVYDFSELSKEAKERAIEKWYEQEDYPFLSDNLEDSLKELLKQNKIEIKEDLNLLYSLSCSQGDGLCFIGNFKWKKFDVTITHCSNYYHSNSALIFIENEEVEESSDNIYDKFRVIYTAICNKLEKQGYAELEYRMDDEEFTEHCEANEYTFTANGIMENI